MPESCIRCMIRSMDVGVRSDLAPGAALRVLPAGVALFSPEESVWQAMLTGWRTQQLARMLRVSTVEGRVRAVERFQQFTGTYPWSWAADDVESWLVSLRMPGLEGGGRSVGTLRNYQSTVAWFCSYLVNPAYGWTDLCGERFREHPTQICHEGIGALASTGRGAKGWLAAFRDATILKFIYAYGLRRNESLRVDTVDFHRSPTTPEFGDFASCSVRYGKASKGSPPKRRTVLTVLPWSVEVLQEYLTEVRPRYEPDGNHLFPTERGGRVSGTYLDTRFAEYRDAVGLPPELHLHCLRHSYVTHLVEDGFDPFFVQQQVGHAYSSTTALYTGVSNDFKNRTLRRALDRYIDPHLTAETHDLEMEGDQA